MGYRKRYTRRSRGGRDKYSMENRIVNYNLSDQGTELVVAAVRYQNVLTIVPGTSLQGMRKVKHITIQITGTDNNIRLYFAVIYVPIGTTPNQLGAVAFPDTLYEPSQFVMGSGCVDAETGPNRIHIPTSRNLNEGDQLVLLTGSPNANGVQGIVSYAICYN